LKFEPLRISASVAFVALLCFGCSSTAPVPIAPNLYYISAPITEERDQAAAQALAERVAHGRCERDGMETAIQDSRFVPGEGGEPDAVDLVFRCAETVANADL
jgi:hypothetical protein